VGPTGLVIKAISIGTNHSEKPENSLKQSGTWINGKLPATLSSKGSHSGQEVIFDFLSFFLTI